MTLADYDVLATLFVHPDTKFEANLTRAIAHCDASYAGAASALREFQSLVPMDDLLALQELHTRTFDVQPITSLDIGYTLFGEDYKRGALLANLSREHAQAEIVCGTELGDHLTNVLRLLPRMADVAVRAELVHVLLAPALREMIREFEPGRLAKKEEIYRKHHKTIIEVAEGDRRTAYLHALEALYAVLKRDFALKTPLPVEQESTFAVSVSAEMGMECNTSCAVK
ncbi:MAG: hypothetical protein IT360_18920 [Gemmatimonadaceae bacterium]|nr:hypothetical protein [Gemmatimonadaceae bacterium]